MSENCNRRAHYITPNEFPEFCRIIHEQMNAQSARLEDHIISLEHSYHEKHLRLEKSFQDVQELQLKIFREIEIWKSNARVIRWIAVGLGAGVVWLLDKWQVISNHFNHN